MTKKFGLKSKDINEYYFLKSFYGDGILLAKKDGRYVYLSSRKIGTIGYSLIQAIQHQCWYQPLTYLLSQFEQSSARQ